MTGGEGLLALQKWPEYEESKTIDAQTEIAVQVNGKLRTTVVVPTGAPKEDIIAAAKADEKAASLLNGRTIVKEIYVPGRLVNIVCK